MKQRDYMVCVKCLTFNQAQYVKDTLDGFCRQETSFPYVCIIVDDASTDGEQDVISNYLQANFDLTDKETVWEEDNDDFVLRYARHKKNVNCYFAVLFLKYNHYNKKSKDPYIKEWIDNSRYIALCEGDDYWTDQYKLQKQVTFLESHGNYVLSCHRFSIFDTDKNVYESDGYDTLFKGKKGVTFDKRYDYWITKTLSLVYRTEAVDEYDKYPGGKRDRVLVYFLLKNGMGYCFNDNMGVYRRSSTGVFGKKTNYQKALDRYRSARQLYDYDRNSITRYRYFIPLLQVLYYSHGKDICELTIMDVLYLPVFIVTYFFKRLKGSHYLIYD